VDISDRLIAHELINDIVSSSRIPSGKRREEVLRELRSHVEDFVLATHEAGHTDDEIQRLVISSLGDPGQIARGFAWVYRRERAVLHLCVFVLSTLVTASLLSAAIFAMQAGVAIGFGTPAIRVLTSRHTVIEALDILSTVAAYAGFVSLEKLFDDHRFQKALALVTLAFAAAMAVCAATDVHAPFLVFGFVSGVFLRAIQVFLKSRMLRTGIVVTCFALVGLVSLQVRSPGLQSAVAMNLASWLVMGAGYQMMTDLAARVDAALSQKA
jgi:hypothetical protein